MPFWDSSALVPLLLSEPRSEHLMRLSQSEPEVVVWWGTRVECNSALQRKNRDGLLDVAALQMAMREIEILGLGWTEVQPTERLRLLAERLLGSYPLRSGDALQLAAAITWRGPEAIQGRFVCLDERLRQAASREGFALLP